MIGRFWSLTIPMMRRRFGAVNPRPPTERSGHPTDILVSEMFEKHQIDEAFFMQLFVLTFVSESDGVET